jgi:SP family general alpha glucoside:H+ symporter-like MFS transporter
MAMEMTGLGVIRALVPNIKPEAFRIAFAIQWHLAVGLVVLFMFVPEQVHSTSI